MTSKFKIEYYHKLPQTASPYYSPQAKKKIFGYKYELIRNEKSMSQHNKSTGDAQQSTLTQAFQNSVTRKGETQIPEAK